MWTGLCRARRARRDRLARLGGAARVLPGPHTAAGAHRLPLMALRGRGAVRRPGGGPSPMNRLRPSDMVASFDSASVLHAGLAAALHGRPFPHLGHSAATGAAIRVAG